MKSPVNYSFDVETTVDNQTGELLAVYFRVRKAKVHQTIEIVDGYAYADYNRRGELIGIELLGPCDVSVVDKIRKADVAAKSFIRSSAPRGILVEAGA